MIDPRMLGSVGGLASAELRPIGTLDIESADEFRQGAVDLLGSGILGFFVDLSGVEYIDSTGLGTLMYLYREVKGRGGAVRFYGLTPAVLDVFKLTHLDKVVEIAPTRDEALARAEGR